MDESFFSLVSQDQKLKQDLFHHSATDFKVFFAMLLHFFEAGTNELELSLNELKNFCDLSYVTTLHSVDSLEEKGLIQITRRGYLGRSNIFKLVETSLLPRSCQNIGDKAEQIEGAPASPNLNLAKEIGFRAWLPSLNLNLIRECFPGRVVTQDLFREYFEIKIWGKEELQSA